MEWKTEFPRSWKITLEIKFDDGEKLCLNITPKWSDTFDFTTGRFRFGYANLSVTRSQCEPQIMHFRSKHFN
jgi:hypothetical protein